MIAQDSEHRGPHAGAGDGLFGLAEVGHDRGQEPGGQRGDGGQEEDRGQAELMNQCGTQKRSHEHAHPKCAAEQRHCAGSVAHRDDQDHKTLASDQEGGPCDATDEGGDTQERRGRGQGRTHHRDCINQASPHQHAPLAGPSDHRPTRQGREQHAQRHQRHDQCRGAHTRAQITRLQSEDRPDGAVPDRGEQARTVRRHRAGSWRGGR